MFSRHILALLFAAAVSQQRASAFMPSTHMALQPTMMHASSRALVDPSLEKPFFCDVAQSQDQDTATILDSRLTRVDSQETKPSPTKKAQPKRAGNPHKEGVLSPIVYAAGTVIGKEQLNKIRAKFISLHSDVIKSFVDTSDSIFGKSVLRQLFNLVDADGSEYLDKSELAVALDVLGFKWLKEKQIKKIFERADSNGDQEISLEEFIQEAPKTLRVNLVKLAKTNGGEMGLLV